MESIDSINFLLPMLLPYHLKQIVSFQHFFLYSQQLWLLQLHQLINNTLLYLISFQLLSQEVMRFQSRDLDLYSRIASLLGKAIGRKLSTVECCLLIDEAAVTIVAGNIRRSAGMRQFASDDKEAASAKENLWSQLTP